jgi:hypothetical protein
MPHMIDESWTDEARLIQMIGKEITTTKGTQDIEKTTLLGRPLVSARGWAG